MHAKVFLVIVSLLLSSWVSASTLCCSLLEEQGGGMSYDSMTTESDVFSGSISLSESAEKKPCHSDIPQQLKSKPELGSDHSTDVDCKCKGCAQQNFVFEPFVLKMERIQESILEASGSSFLGYPSRIFHPPI